MKYFILFSLILSSIFINAQDLILTNSHFGDTLVNPAELNIDVKSADYNPGEPAHLNIINTESGYRKLKLGNNTSTIYSPKVNVCGGGNDQLRIVLRDISGSADWSKIRFRPAAIGSLSLKTYVDSVGGITSEWTTLLIPLSDFDAAIDYSQLAFIEFPYSADAPPFEIDIAKIEFIGGLTPYIWYGDNKKDNIHDGFGGAGQLIAKSEAAIESENTLESIELYINNTLFATDITYPFEFNIVLNTLGLNNFYSIARFNDNSSKTSEIYTVYIEEFIPLDLGIELVSPKINDTVLINTTVKLMADIFGTSPSEHAYLSVTNQNSGYLKLKLGYDPVNIYAPGKNVIAGGNDKLIITLKNLSGFTNWSKLRMRPKAIGSLNLESYVITAGGVADEWTTIEIPLSDFDPTIDFTNLNYMEFPYSADAGSFQLTIKDIIFTGGDQDFRWFGEDKTDNIHDGFGGSGQLIAEVIEAQFDENSIEAVEFYIDDNLIDTDNYFPYETDFIPESEGEYIASAKVITQNLQTASSSIVAFTALMPENPVSDLQISFTEPNTGDSILVNQILNFIPFIEGEDLETEIYLKTWNTETGYKKLKFGYDDLYIYGHYQNVTAGGNDTLEIILKSFSSQPNWSKIRIRPSAVGSLTLDNYVTTDAGDWISIKIPLSDFDAAIDFSNLSYIEFPYSADAGAFEIGIKEVRFIGGTTPFEWFGPNHYNNIHDGTGENGNIFAQLQLPSPNPIVTDTVYFVVNGSVDSYSTVAPYQFSYSNATVAINSFSFKIIDSYGYSAYSETIDIKFYDLYTEDFSVLTLTFNEDPGDVQVSLAPLKYNKDFAYSLSLDDGRLDGYSYAFKLLNGGQVTDTGESFDGLFYTDGCGNNVPFKASLAWNSVNSSFIDLHINTPDYITWVQLQEMISAGWDVMNHSYSHAAYGDTDYAFQITENQNVVLAKTGFEMTQFVIPSGDLNYVDPAFGLRMDAVYSNKYEFLGYGTAIDIDSPFNTFQLKIDRRFLYDDLFIPTNIMEKINDVANNSQNGNHLWANDFTHRVIPTPTSGSLVWDTFKSYMQQIASEYGANGTDRIWFAPQVDILNYLTVRENTSVVFEKSGNTVNIYLNTTEIPENFLDYFLSLNVTADAELLSVSPQFSANINFANTNQTEKLINIEWSQPTMKRMQSISAPDLLEEENNIIGFDIYPNPVLSPQINIDFSVEKEEELSLRLISSSGQEVLNQTVISQEGFNALNLNLPDLNKGIYFLMISGETQLFKTEKILIQ
ncbi:MAG: T9SS type A sorting domain-containing protein [Bacteroidales bacterium]|nr:T9SS type A sorting domain-containing protein [Bacteroidales bacterium]